MVFSFFKKDAKDTRTGVDRGGSGQGRATRPDQKTLSRPLGGAVNRSLNRPTSPDGGVGFAVTEAALPDRETARSIAMATAAKIDAIESEMARDFLRPYNKTGDTGQPAAGEAPPAATAPTPTALPTAAGVAKPAEAPKPAEDHSDPDQDIMHGSIDAIVVEAGNDAILEETAILFANRQDEAAESGLRAAVAGEMLGASVERGWLMLLELLQQRGDRAGFDQLAMQFFQRFGTAAPAWINYGETAAPARPAAARSGSPMVQLPETIDANIVKPLEEFKGLAVANPSLTLDVSATRRVDLVGAELLLRVFNAFKRATHELNVRGAEQLMLALRQIAVAGRRDPSDAAWMLLLEVQRLLGRQADFEETGIQYCITYEVSPPSWEPPPPNMHATNAPAAAAAPATAKAAEGVEWKGDIAGDGEAHFSRIDLAARAGSPVAVDCRHLRRMAFSTSTAMLGHLIRLQQAGARIEFHNVNSLVAVLWSLLGVASVADVHVRTT